MEHLTLAERPGRSLVGEAEDAARRAARPVEVPRVARERHAVGDAGLLEEAGDGAVEIDAVEAARTDGLADRAGKNPPFRIGDHVVEARHVRVDALAEHAALPVAPEERDAIRLEQE